MKKLFVVVLLASTSVVGCGGKKASTTPTNTDPAMQEKNGDPTGGAAYGGKAAPAGPTSKDAPTPSANH